VKSYFIITKGFSRPFITEEPETILPADQNPGLSGSILTEELSEAATEEIFLSGETAEETSTY
jgi:hypothetical protein